jgi:hypothetical protein
MKPFKFAQIPSKAIPNEKLSVKYHQHPFKASMDNHVCSIIPSEDISDACVTGFVPFQKSAILMQLWQKCIAMLHI